MFSNNRDFIDSIDVEDTPCDYTTAYSYGTRPRSHSRPMSMTSTSTSASIPSLSSITSSASSSQLVVSPQTASSFAAAILHCSLFLFNDKLMIVKRQSSGVSGRKVTGLDDIQKLVKTGGGVAVMDKTITKKDKLSFRGVVDILDVIASDTGNGGELSLTSMFLIKSVRLSNLSRATAGWQIRQMVRSPLSIIHYCASSICRRHRCRRRPEGKVAFRGKPVGGASFS